MGAGGPDYEDLSFQHRQLGLGMGELQAHHPEHGQVGRLQYQDQNWDPGSHLSVEMLMVPPEHKRRGVASALMGELERRHPGALIQHGTRTMSGADWAASYYGPGANRWGGHGVYGKPTRDRTVLTAALSGEDRVSVAESVMERAGHAGRSFEVPQNRENWQADREHPAARYLHGVLIAAGHPEEQARHLRVYQDRWGLRHGGQANTDGLNMVGTGPTVNELGLLHEGAHILTRTAEADGHGPAFLDAAHRLYHEHLSPEAAQIFHSIARPTTKQASDWHEFDTNHDYRTGHQHGAQGEMRWRDQAQARVDVQRHDQHDVDYLVGHAAGTERARENAASNHAIRQMFEQAPEYNSIEHQVDMLGHELRHREGVAEQANDWGIFWHGTPSGDLRGGASGLHVGTQEAARQALHARIGFRADGKDWDGTQEYGTTLLAGKQNLLGRPRGRYLLTGHNADDYHAGSERVPLPDEDHYPEEHHLVATFGEGREPVQPHHKPDLFPVRITGPMSNTPQTAHPDSKANGYMKAQITRGTARRGYFYRNEGEDSGSISAVVPHGGHLQRVDRTEHQAAHTAAEDEPQRYTISHEPMKLARDVKRLHGELDDADPVHRIFKTISGDIRGPRGAVAVARDRDGAVAGMISYQHPAKTSGTEVSQLRVHPDHQRSGVASALMQSVREQHPDQETRVYGTVGNRRSWYVGTGAYYAHPDTNVATYEPLEPPPDSQSGKHVSPEASRHTAASGLEAGNRFAQRLDDSEDNEPYIVARKHEYARDYIAPGGQQYRLLHDYGGFTNSAVTAHQRLSTGSYRGAGYLSWFGGTPRHDGSTVDGGVIHKVHVSGPHRRRGLASAMLSFARERKPEMDVRHSSALTDEGRAWAEHTAAASPTDPAKLGRKHLDDIRAMVHAVRSHECHGGQCGFTSENLAREHGWPMYGGIYHAPDGRPIGDHVWNVHEPSGTIIDSTADQFGEGHDVRVLPPTHPDHARYRHAESDAHEEQLLDQARATTAEHGDYWWVPGGKKNPHVRSYLGRERRYKRGEEFDHTAAGERAAAISTPCQTPEVNYDTVINDHQIGVTAEMPMPVNLDEQQAETLDRNLHNMMEMVLAPLFPPAYDPPHTAAAEWVRPSQLWPAVRDLSLPHQQRKVDELVRSIAEHGYRPEMADLPINAGFSQGQPWIGEGHHRLRAMQQLGYDQPIPVHTAAQFPEMAIFRSQRNTRVSRNGEHTSAEQPSFVHEYETQGSTGYESRRDVVHGPFYHGGTARLAPGGMLKPGRKPNPWGDEFNDTGRSVHTHFATEPSTAISYARSSGGHLYEIEPTGEVHYDGSGGAGSYKSKHPLRVLRRVPPEEWDSLTPGRIERQAAADWHEFRRVQDTQQRRYERPGIGGSQEDRDRYFGTGQMMGRGQERLVSPKDWITHSRAEQLRDTPPEFQENWRGHQLGRQHGQGGAVRHEELDAEYARSPHPDHFAEGYAEGLEEVLG
jgi:ribosomal protein S18 acetylase RimI-like enzyme